GGDESGGDWEEAHSHEPTKGTGDPKPLETPATKTPTGGGTETVGSAGKQPATAPPTTTKMSSSTENAAPPNSQPPTGGTAGGGASKPPGGGSSGGGDSPTSEPPKTTESKKVEDDVNDHGRRVDAWKEKREALQKNLGKTHSQAEKIKLQEQSKALQEEAEALMREAETLATAIAKLPEAAKFKGSSGKQTLENARSLQKGSATISAMGATALTLAT